jgi:hypothetical protein
VSDLLSSVTPPLHRLGVLWTFQTLLFVGLSFPTFIHWYNRMRYDARRHKINAWHHWCSFCRSRHLTLSIPTLRDNHAHLASEFFLYLLEGEFASFPARAAKSAAVFLCGQLLNISDLGYNRTVMSFTDSII